MLVNRVFSAAKRVLKRAGAALAAVCVMAWMAPITAFSLDGENGHIHDAECGYVEGSACTYLHIHSEACGYAPPSPCSVLESSPQDTAHIHDAACGYSAGSPCNDVHIHDAACGYVAAVPCAFEIGQNNNGTQSGAPPAAEGETPQSEEDEEVSSDTDPADLAGESAEKNSLPQDAPKADIFMGSAVDTVTDGAASARAQEVSVVDAPLSYGAAFNMITETNTAGSYARSDIFPKTAENNGRIWTDKSVTPGADADADEFLVTLSAMGQSVQSERQQSVPSDTVFILDISYSMTGELNTGESRVAVMVEALNDAIDTLMHENEHNRVAVVAFGGVAGNAGMRPILSLDRYEEVKDGNYFSMKGKAYVRVNSEIPDEKLIDVPETRDIRLLGGTPTQWGIYAGAGIFTSQANIPQYTVNGVTQPPKPNIVLLTDGEPTYGWEDYDFSEPASNTQTGYSTGNGNDVDMGPEILTVLTATHFKQKVTDKYYPGDPNKSAGFYTIGLGVSDSDDARATLNPMGEVGEAGSGRLNVGEISKSLDRQTYNMQTVLDSFVNTGTAIFPTIGRRQEPRRLATLNGNPQNPADKPIKSYGYVDYYAAAETAEDLREFFKDITQMIVSVGSYATSVIAEPDGTYAQFHTSYADYSGAVVFSDVIGEYMEFKSADYLVFDNRQYNGAVFAHLVEKENPSNQAPDIGSYTAAPTTAKLMDAVFASQVFYSGASTNQSQSDVADMVEGLVTSSLMAASGAASGGVYGIYYNSAADYGNRIRYYAGADGRFAAYYFDEATGGLLYPNNAGLPTEAVCIVDQYFVSGATHNPVSGNPSDLTYSVFEVITPLATVADTVISERNFQVTGTNTIENLDLPSHTLKPRQQLVRWRIPASILPLRSVKPEAVIDASPIRFQYSVGLQSDFSFNGVEADYLSKTGGNYYFYANAFMEQENAAMAHFVPGTNNPYYQAGRSENQPASAAVTGTAGFVTRGPVEKNPSNGVWYYSLGNNGRLSVPLTDIEVIKEWAADIQTPPGINAVEVQLYGGGEKIGGWQSVVPLGPADPNRPTPAVDPVNNHAGSVRWENLPLYQPQADGTGNAMFIQYMVQEGSVSGGVFTPYDGSPDNVAPYTVSYSQPTYNALTGLTTARIYNASKFAVEWTLKIDKAFSVNGVPQTNFYEELNRQGRSIEFIPFVNTGDDIDSDASTADYVRMDFRPRGAVEPILYPDHFTDGECKILMYTDADPEALGEIEMILVEKSAVIDGYTTDTVNTSGSWISASARGSAGAGYDSQSPLPAEYKFYRYVFASPNDPAPIGSVQIEDAEVDTYTYAHSVTGIEPNAAITFNFINNLTAAPPPAASLSLQKELLVTGGAPADLDGHFSASFVVEGWKDQAAAGTGDITKRIFYYATDNWEDLDAPGDFRHTGLTPGWYTVTETSASTVTDNDGTVYDRALTVEGVSAPVENIAGGGQRISFQLNANEDYSITLVNTYTPRPQLTIQKVFSAQHPAREDIAFAVTDSAGKTVRFISFDEILFGTGSLGSGGAYTIKDLQPGTYTVSEISGEAADGYYPVRVSASGAGAVMNQAGTAATVTLTAGGAAVGVTFTNTYIPLPANSLTVQKELGGYPEDWGVYSTTLFRVRIKDVTDPAAARYLIFDGGYNFTGQTSATGGTELVISENTRATVFGLVQNRRYAVEEIVPQGAAHDAPQYLSGGLPVQYVTTGSQPLTVTVLNNYQHSTAGALVISKELLGHYADWGVTGSTRFNVRIYDEDQGNYLWFVEGANSEEPQEVAALAGGGVYWCVGNAQDGFSEAVSRSKAVYTELPLTVGTSLALQNLWADADGWHYRVEEVVPAEQSGRYQNGGVARVVLYGDAGGGPAAASNTRVSIRNTFRESPGNLIITKRLAGSPADWGVNTNTAFYARVRQADGARQYLAFGANNAYLETNAAGSYVAFSQSVPAVLTGIPSGNYVVEERLPSGAVQYYSVTYEGDASAAGEVQIATGGPSKTVTAVNTYQHDTGRLIVGKSLSGHYSAAGAGADDKFSAQVYEQGAAGENRLYFALLDEEMNLYKCVGSTAGISDPAFAGMAVDNVNLFDTLPFSANAPAIADGLWVGVTYRIEEIGGGEYNVRYTGGGQSLPRDGQNATGNISITAINTYSGGNTDDGGDGDAGGGGGTHQNPLTRDAGGVMTPWVIVLAVSLLGMCGLLWWRRARTRIK